MTNAAMCAETRQSRRDVDHEIKRAFLAAHLLTANTEQAERAVLEAIDQRHSAEQTEDAFFARMVTAAIRTQAGYESSSVDNPEPDEWLLPTELEAVLDLSPPLRRCFVLRMLAGLSRDVCARLLRLNVRTVDQYTAAALECLGGAHPVSLPRHPTRIPNSSYLETRFSG